MTKEKLTQIIEVLERVNEVIRIPKNDENIELAKQYKESLTQLKILRDSMP